MPDPIDTLEVQLLQAGYRLQRSRLSRWRTRLGYRAQLVAIAAGALLVVAPAIAAVTQTWPGGGDRGPAEAPRIQFSTSDSGLDAMLRRSFSVLTRDQTNVDRLPEDATLPPIVRGVQLNSVHRLLQTPMGGVYLVAVDAVLPKPLQVLAENQRVGPPGVCVALTADAPASFSCAPTRQLLGPGAGLSFQTAACVADVPTDMVSLRGLAVDQVSNIEAQLTDGTSRPIAIRSNLIDARFAGDNPPRRLRWNFNGTPAEREVLTPPPASRCEPGGTP